MFTTASSESRDKKIFTWNLQDRMNAKQYKT